MDIKKLAILLLLFISFNVFGMGAPSFVITVNEPDGSTKNITLNADQMARMQAALQKNDMNTVNAIIDGISKKKKKPAPKKAKKKAVAVKKFQPVDGYYEAQQIEQRAIDEEVPAFTDPHKYVAKKTKLKLSKACENRLRNLRTKLSKDPKNQVLTRYINAYTKQCEDEAVKLVDSHK